MSKTIARFKARKIAAEGPFCSYCGREYRQRVLEVDHIIPKSQGGRDTPANFTLACQRCNGSKGPQLLHEWLDRIRVRRDALADELEYLNDILCVASRFERIGEGFAAYEDLQLLVHDTAQTLAAKA